MDYRPSRRRRSVLCISRSVHRHPENRRTGQPQEILRNHRIYTAAAFAHNGGDGGFGTTAGRCGIGDSRDCDDVCGELVGFVLYRRLGRILVDQSQQHSVVNSIQTVGFDADRLHDFGAHETRAGITRKCAPVSRIMGDLMCEPVHFTAPLTWSANYASNSVAIRLRVQKV